MKVYESQNGVLQEIRRKRPNTPESGGFQRVMDQVKAQTDALESQQARAQTETVPNGIRILAESQKVEGSPGVLETKEVVEGLEQTLDLLDFYALKLSDPSFSIKDMSPIITHLEERLEGMRNMQSTSPLPDGLSSVFSDTMITIGTEIAKFRRGDYS